METKNNIKLESRAITYLRKEHDDIKLVIEELEKFTAACLVRFAKAQAENLLTKYRQKYVAISAILEEYDKSNK